MGHGIEEDVQYIGIALSQERHSSYRVSATNPRRVPEGVCVSISIQATLEQVAAARH